MLHTEYKDLYCVGIKRYVAVFCFFIILYYSDVETFCSFSDSRCFIVLWVFHLQTLASSITSLQQLHLFFRAGNWKRQKYCAVRMMTNTLLSLSASASEMHPWWRCVGGSRAWAQRRSELCPKMSCRCPWPWRTSLWLWRRSPSLSLLRIWRNTKPGWLSLGQYKEWLPVDSRLGNVLLWVRQHIRDQQIGAFERHNENSYQLHSCVFFSNSFCEALIFRICGNQYF